MRRPHVHPALRNGLTGAVIIAALGSVNALVQARRHAIGPSAQALVVFSYLFVLVAVLLLLAVGFLTARSTGRVRAGAWAGAITAGLPSALLVLVVSLQTAIPQDLPHSTQIAGDVVAILLFAAAGALAGAVVSLPGTLIGRARYRVEHVEELAALAAERAAHDVAMTGVRAVAPPAATSRPRKKSEWIFVWLVAVALALLAAIPGLAAQWVYDTLTRWQGLLLAVSALVAGLALLKAANRRHWLGYVLDWLGVLCLSCAVALGIAELISVGKSPIAGVGALLYLWRYVALGQAPQVHYSLPPTEPPEQPPVFFRHGGQAIVIYPSRRKLAAHAAFAGGVALVATTLAVLFRAAGPTPVLGLGGFAVMGLIGFVPDLVRLLHRWPALIVNSDGVTDLASAQIVGFGLIPWHEIAGIVNAGARRGGAFPELAIIPMSYHRLLTRQPFLKRPFLRLGSAMGGGGIYISSIVLSQPPSELAQRIYDFVKLHAPAGYMELDEREDNAENATHA